MHPLVMKRFAHARLARMSSGRYCLIRDLGLVKGGKGMRHHEVLLELSWRGLLRALKAGLRLGARGRGDPQPDQQSAFPTTFTAGPRRVPGDASFHLGERF
jgi:hypothetical protein